MFAFNYFIQLYYVLISFEHKDKEHKGKKHKIRQERRQKKTDRSTSGVTCDVFPLHFPTQEKQIINSPMGRNTQIE